jgi:uncharacterized protein involved in exopolysaccharide biosynthesis
MGSPDISFTDKSIEAEAAKAGRTCYEKHSEMSDDDLTGFDLEMLLGKIVDLTDLEKEYKRYEKKGYSVLATYFTSNGAPMLTAAISKEAIERQLANKQGITEVKYYGKGDFDIK